MKAMVAHLAFIARRWLDHCNAWLVRCQTYGYLPSRIVPSPLINRLYRERFAQSISATRPRVEPGTSWLQVQRHQWHRYEQLIINEAGYLQECPNRVATRIPQV